LVQGHWKFRLLLAGFWFLLPLAAGCAAGGPQTHAVDGRVTWPAGDSSALAGNHIEVILLQDPGVRATGLIGADGRFALETLEKGQLLKRARQGNYQARLVLVDEGDGASRKLKIPKKYLDMKTSGWSLQVPARESVNLVIASR
jgi:hypothetical protein